MLGQLFYTAATSTCTPTRTVQLTCAVLVVVHVLGAAVSNTWPSVRDESPDRWKQVMRREVQRVEAKGRGRLLDRRASNRRAPGSMCARVHLPLRPLVLVINSEAALRTCGVFCLPESVRPGM